jgi:hypothetical protein
MQSGRLPWKFAVFYQKPNAKGKHTMQIETEIPANGATAPPETPKRFALVVNRANMLIGSLVKKVEASRYTLASINITPKHTEVTNGHFAVRVSLPEIAVESLPEPEAAKHEVPIVDPGLRAKGERPALESALRPGEIVEAVRVPAMTPSAKWGYVKACRKPGEFAHAIAAVLIDPESATARAVIGAVDAAPIVVGDAAALFGGRVTGDFARQFDARVADAILMKAGIADAAGRHIHGAVLRRAVAEAST